MRYVIIVKMKDILEDSVREVRFQIMLKNAKIGEPYFYWQKVANQLCQPLQNLNLTFQDFVVVSLRLNKGNFERCGVMNFAKTKSYFPPLKIMRNINVGFLTWILDTK